MKISKETEQNIAQLQLLEQNLQNFILQRQNFQMQLIEIENALKELEKTGENPFKVIGNLMVVAKKEDLKKDLMSKKEILELRIKNIEKQEGKIKERAEELQKLIVETVKEE